MPEVSVIVPVHNAEDHIRQCLDSIVSQTLADIEIICVDDGSTDGSPEVLEDYARRDSRISVIRQDNSYAGVARNRGMEAASGKYLVFWDADDYFKPEALEKMHDRCEEHAADICVCGVLRYYQQLGEEIPVDVYLRMQLVPDELPFSCDSNRDNMLTFTNESVWNKMFRRAFVEDRQLRFQPCRNGNDVYFVACALCLADKITVAPDYLVCYRTMQESGLVSTLSKSAITPFKAWIDVRRSLEQGESFPRDSYVRKAASSTFFLLCNVSDWNAFEEAVRFLQEGGMSELLLDDVRDEDFYLAPWHKEFVEHLGSDSPEELLAYLDSYNYRARREQWATMKLAIERLRSKMDHQGEILARVRADRDRIASDRFYRMGRVLTAPFRALRKG